MKKIILAVILVAATGGIAYYLLQDNSQTGIAGFNQEQIIGKWKIDSSEYIEDSVSLPSVLRRIVGANRLNYDDFR